jgi:SAM-dependent methyltransferase
MFFVRKATLERLPVAMSGVRMGERALQIGVDDPNVVGAIAAKVGLSGHAAMALVDQTSAAKARSAAAAAGVLADVQITALNALPFADGFFDVIVIHAAGGPALSAQDTATLSVLRESHRVLRRGGRIVVIEAGTPHGLKAWLKPRHGQSAPGRAATALGASGFRTARTLADREGYLFTEGIKS